MTLFHFWLILSPSPFILIFVYFALELTSATDLQGERGQAPWSALGVEIRENRKLILACALPWLILANGAFWFPLYIPVFGSGGISVMTAGEWFLTLWGMLGLSGVALSLASAIRRDFKSTIGGAIVVTCVAMFAWAAFMLVLFATRWLDATSGLVPWGLAGFSGCVSGAFGIRRMMRA